MQIIVLTLLTICSRSTIVAEEIQRRLRKPSASGKISFDNYLTLFEVLLSSLA